MFKAQSSLKKLEAKIFVDTHVCRFIALYSVAYLFERLQEVQDALIIKIPGI